MGTCTFVIPTYRRPAYLRRALEFYFRQGGAFPIIVADGGNDDVRSQNAASIANYAKKGLPVRHLIVNEPPSVAGQVLAGMEAVETPYCIFISDDDFIGRHFVESAIAHLDVAPNCSAVAGQRVSFAVEGDIPHGRIVDAILYQAPTHTEPTTADRILSMEKRHAAGMQTYNLYESVRRKKDWLAIAGSWVACRNLNPAWATTGYTLLNTFADELLMSHLTLAQGELHIQPGLNVGLTRHGEQVGGAVFHRTDGISVFTDAMWARSWELYRDILTTAVAAADNIGLEDATEVIEAAAWLRMSHFLNKSLTKRISRLKEVARSAVPHRVVLDRVQTQLTRLRKRTAQRKYARPLKAGCIPRGPDFSLLWEVVERLEADAIYYP